jgi:periplasmic divalent cation tolerance protein
MAKYDDVERCIKEIHGYDVPEILALPVVAGNQAYLKWLDQEVEP